MANRLVDLINRRLELAARDLVVATEIILELFHLGFEVRNVDILLFVLR